MVLPRSSERAFFSDVMRTTQPCRATKASVPRCCHYEAALQVMADGHAEPTYDTELHLHAASQSDLPCVHVGITTIYRRSLNVASVLSTQGCAGTPAEGARGAGSRVGRRPLQPNGPRGGQHCFVSDPAPGAAAVRNRGKERPAIHKGAAVCCTYAPAWWTVNFM